MTLERSSADTHERLLSNGASGRLPVRLKKTYALDILLHAFSA